MKKDIWRTIILAVLVSLCFAVIPFWEFVNEMGHRIPQDDMTGDYTLACLWAIVLVGTILVWPVNSSEKKAVVIVWSFKVFITLGFMLLYENHYGLDAYHYFSKPNTDSFLWEGLMFGKGTHNMVHLSWLHQQLLPDSYHSLKITCAFIGLIAVYLIYRAAVIFLNQEDVKIFYLISLFPSTLFWSSILGKDPIVLLGIALYIYGVVFWRKKNSISGILMISLGVFISAFIRVWLAAILIIPLSVFIVRGIRTLTAKIVFVCFVLISFMYSYYIFQERFCIETTQDIYATTDRVSQSWSHGGSGQAISYSLNSPLRILLFIPAGGFTALYRPLPGEINNLFGLMAGVENGFLLLITWIAIKRFRKNDLKEPIVLWAIVLIGVWASVYGLVSYQNLGSASRFRLQIIPVLLGLLMYLGRPENVHHMSDVILYGTGNSNQNR